jgi:16S rRNA (guanine966-N2)-methyltransferase
MRITGGAATGIRLHAPRNGGGIRPATDRLRESVFASLGPEVHGAAVLDLFAGTGAYGLEALSRGAARIVWVEANARTAAVLRENRDAVLRSVGRTVRSQVLVRDVVRVAFPPEESFRFVFADPPYAEAGRWIAPVFGIAERHLSQDPPGRLVFEMPSALPVERPGWEEVRQFGKERNGPSVRFFARTNRPESHTV